MSEHKRNSNIGVGVGILLSIIGNSMGSGLGMILLIAGTVAFIWGCSEFAQAKGYSPWFGALGLLSLLGLIVLVLLPNKHKAA
jgi:hypothetical protein